MIIFTFIIICISFQFVLIMSSVWHTIYSFLWSYDPSLDPENSYNDYENIQTDPIELAPAVIVLRDTSAMSNIVLKDSSQPESISPNHDISGWKESPCCECGRFHELPYASREEYDVAEPLQEGYPYKIHKVSPFTTEEVTAYKITGGVTAAKSTEDEDDSDDEFIKALPMTTCDLL